MQQKIDPGVPAASQNNWEYLFEAALLEAEPAMIERRLQSAQDAIVDRIEDSFDKASFLERQVLLAALNTINEFQRPNVDDLRHRPSQTFGHGA
jgi:hypothetical protein